MCIIGTSDDDDDDCGSEAGSLISKISIDDRRGNNFSHFDFSSIFIRCNAYCDSGESDGEDQVDGLDRKTFTGSLLDDLVVPTAPAIKDIANKKNAFKVTGFQKVLLYKSLNRMRSFTTST